MKILIKKCFWATVCKTVPLCYRSVACPVCNVRALWPNCGADQDDTWHAGRPRPWPHCVRWGPSSPSPCLLWPNGWMDEAGTWHGGRPHPRRLCVRWGPSASPKRGRSPLLIFGPFLLWPNGWMHQDATWYGCRPQPRGLCVTWRPTPLPQKGNGAPKFSAHVYCGQTA